MRTPAAGAGAPGRSAARQSAAVEDQAIGGRSGGAAGIDATTRGHAAGGRAAGVGTQAIRCGTPSITMHAARQWQPPWQQAGVAGAAGTCAWPVRIASAIAIAPQSTVADAIAACACAVDPGMDGDATAPSVSDVHASNAMASTARNRYTWRAAKRRTRRA